MSIELEKANQISIKGFFNVNSHEPSGWSIRIRRSEIPGKVMIGLFWQDKEVATHCTFEDLEEFTIKVVEL
jgi:hypothetical protein